jgi:pimeloyl-ACP methyl ester carboxylesterase
LDIFDNSSRISGVTCPAWIIHGTADEDVPFHHGFTLSDILERSGNGEVHRWWIEGRGHNDCFEGGTEEVGRR